MSEQESFWNTGSFAVITDNTRPAMKWTIDELAKRVDLSGEPNKGALQTETPLVKKICSESQIQCITGKCPMMYLGHGFNMHTMHRSIAKLLGHKSCQKVQSINAGRL